MDTKKVWEEIKKQFPGKNNRALRDRIFKRAQDSGQVVGLEKTVALTALGKTGLRNVQKVINHETNQN